MPPADLTMIHVTKLLPRGRGLSRVLLQRAATVELDFARRGSGRFEATDSTGRALAVQLPEGTPALHDGDVLVAEDGSLLMVKASAQPVHVVRPCADHGRPADLLRAAHRLGSAHVAAVLHDDHLVVLPDDEVEAMLRGMHLDVEAAQASFDPLPEAHGGPGHGHHDHDHDHGHHGCGHDHHHHHGHHHGHDHAHTPAPASSTAPVPRGRPVAIAVNAAPVPHVHGPGCGHDHDH